MSKLMGISAGVKVGDDWWCISRIVNGLYKMDLTTEKTEYICKMPEKNSLGKQAYIDILYLKNRLFIIPGFAKKIAVFDIVSYQMSEIDIEPFYGGDGESFNVAGGCIYKQWLLLYPCMSSIFIRVDLQTLEVVVDDTFIDGNELKGRVFSYHNRHFQKKEKIYIALATYDGVVCVNVEEFSFYLIKIANSQTGYSAIMQVDDELWLAPNSVGDIVKYDMTRGTVERFGDYPKFFRRNNELAFCDFFCINNTNIILVPCMANMFLDIDRSTGEIKEYVIESEKKILLSTRESVNYIYIHNVKKCRCSCYLSSDLLNSLLIINEKGNIKKSYLIENAERIMDNVISVKESEGFDLEQYIKYLVD